MINIIKIRMNHLTQSIVLKVGLVFHAEQYQQVLLKIDILKILIETNSTTYYMLSKLWQPVARLTSPSKSKMIFFPDVDCLSGGATISLLCTTDSHIFGSFKSHLLWDPTLRLLSLLSFGRHISVGFRFDFRW